MVMPKTHPKLPNKEALIHRQDTTKPHRKGIPAKFRRNKGIPAKLHRNKATLAKLHHNKAILAKLHRNKGILAKLHHNKGILAKLHSKDTSKAINRSLDILDRGLPKGTLAQLLAIQATVADCVLHVSLRVFTLRIFVPFEADRYIFQFKPRDDCFLLT
eukprot:jgi/Phyca11/509227/fgenesh2_kg.PHYCAscaffold_43_\